MNSKSKMNKKTEEPENTNEDYARVIEASSSLEEDEEMGIFQTFWNAIVTFLVMLRPTVAALEVTRSYRLALSRGPLDVQEFDVEDSVAKHGEQESGPPSGRRRRSSARSQIQNASRKSSSASSTDVDVSSKNSEGVVKTPKDQKNTVIDTVLEKVGNLFKGK